MSGWEKRPLGDLCKFQRGLTYAKSAEVELSSSIVLRANNIDLATNALDLSDLRYISDSIPVSDEKKVRKGSLLLCTASGSRSHLGKIAYVDEDYGFAFGGFMGQMIPNPEVDGRFLFHALTSPAYRAFIDTLSHGVNINNLKFDDLRRFSVQLPHLHEQRRIARVLDEAFEAVGIAHVRTAKNLRNARELFRSEVRTLFQRGQCGWTTRTLPEISTNLDKRRVPITKSERNAGDYPYYGASGIVDYVADFIFDEDALLISEDGANLIARSTPIAFSVSGKYWVNNHAHILRFPDRRTQRFVEYYFESIPLDRYVSGAAQPKLNQKALNSIPIPIPQGLDEQGSIVARIDSVHQVTFEFCNLQEQKLAALDQLKNSLFHQAFSGKLTAKSVDKELAEVA